VQLGHIQPFTQPYHLDLFALTEDSQSQSNDLMNTIDSINHRFPQGIAMSSAGIKNRWQTPVEFLSKRYTTHWNELPIVKCR